MRRHERSGFTLVELLIVIAIIGMLVMMVMPAVNQAREAARKVECANNLVQLATACRTHDAKHGHLPSGGWGWQWTGDADRGFGLRQPGGWTYNILPYLELEDVHQLGRGKSDIEKKDGSAGAPGFNAQRETIPQKLFICPTRRRLQLYPSVSSVDCRNSKRQSAVARGDYAANIGDLADFDDYDNGPGSFADEANYNWRLEKYSTASGVIHRRSLVRMEHIKDGASNTYLLGERNINSDHYLTGRASDDDQCLYIGFDRDNTRGVGLNRVPRQDQPGVEYYSQFGGAHNAVFCMVFVDKSVHWIPYSIDPETHRRLGTRAEGKGMTVDHSAFSR